MTEKQEMDSRIEEIKWDDKSELCAQKRASSLAGGMPVWKGLTNRQ